MQCDSTVQKCYKLLSATLIIVLMYLGDQYLREKLIKWRLDSELHCNQENVTGMKAQLDFGQDLAIHRNISEYSLQCGRK